MGFSSLAAWDEDLKVLLQDAPVAGARLLQRLLRPVTLALVVRRVHRLEQLPEKRALGQDLHGVQQPGRLG